MRSRCCGTLKPLGLTSLWWMLAFLHWLYHSKALQSRPCGRRLDGLRLICNNRSNLVACTSCVHSTIVCEVISSNKEANCWIRPCALGSLVRQAISKMETSMWDKMNTCLLKVMSVDATCLSDTSTLCGDFSSLSQVLELPVQDQSYWLQPVGCLNGCHQFLEGYKGEKCTKVRG